MPRLEVSSLSPRDDENYGLAVVALSLDGVELEIRLDVPHAGAPLLVVNERLPGGGIRRVITERLRGRAS